MAEQRLRNRAMEVLDPLSKGADGVREVGVAPWHWRTWSCFTPAEVDGLDAVHRLLVAACGATRGVDATDALIASGTSGLSLSSGTTVASVVFWRGGGATDLCNLVLVCSRHHTLIHERGYQLVLRPDRTLVVRTAEGNHLRHHPALPWEPKDHLDADRHVTAANLPTQWNGDRMDLDHVVWVLAQHAA